MRGNARSRISRKPATTPIGVRLVQKSILRSKRRIRLVLAGMGRSAERNSPSELATWPLARRLLRCPPKIPLRMNVHAPAPTDRRRVNVAVAPVRRHHGALNPVKAYAED